VRKISGRVVECRFSSEGRLFWTAGYNMKQARSCTAVVQIKGTRTSFLQSEKDYIIPAYPWQDSKALGGRLERGLGNITIPGQLPWTNGHADREPVENLQHTVISITLRIMIK